MGRYAAANQLSSITATAAVVCCLIVFLTTAAAPFTSAASIYSASSSNNDTTSIEPPSLLITTANGDEDKPQYQKPQIHHEHLHLIAAASRPDEENAVGKSEDAVVAFAASAAAVEADSLLADKLAAEQSATTNVTTTITASVQDAEASVATAAEADYPSSIPNNNINNTTSTTVTTPVDIMHNNSVVASINDLPGSPVVVVPAPAASVRSNETSHVSATETSARQRTTKRLIGDHHEHSHNGIQSKRPVINLLRPPAQLPVIVADNEINTTSNLTSTTTLRTIATTFTSKSPQTATDSMQPFVTQGDRPNVQPFVMHTLGAAANATRPIVLDPSINEVQHPSNNSSILRLRPVVASPPSFPVTPTSRANLNETSVALLADAVRRQNNRAAEQLLVSSTTANVMNPMHINKELMGWVTYLEQEQALSNSISGETTMATAAATSATTTTNKPSANNDQLPAKATTVTTTNRIRNATENNVDSLIVFRVMPAASVEAALITTTTTTTQSPLPTTTDDGTMEQQQSTTMTALNDDDEVLTTASVTTVPTDVVDVWMHAKRGAATTTPVSLVAALPTMTSTNQPLPSTTELSSLATTTVAVADDDDGEQSSNAPATNAATFNERPLDITTTDATSEVSSPQTAEKLAEPVVVAAIGTTEASVVDSRMQTTTEYSGRIQQVTTEVPTDVTTTEDTPTTTKTTEEPISSTTMAPIVVQSDPSGSESVTTELPGELSALPQATVQPTISTTTLPSTTTATTATSSTTLQQSSDESSDEQQTIDDEVEDIRITTFEPQNNRNSIVDRTEPAVTTSTTTTTGSPATAATTVAAAITLAGVLVPVTAAVDPQQTAGETNTRDGTGAADGLGAGVQPSDQQNAAGTDVNAIIAISVSVVGVVCLVLLVGFLIVMRKRQKLLKYSQRCRPIGLDAYSLDNMSNFNSVRRKGAAQQSKRAYGNPAFEDAALQRNALTPAALAAFAAQRRAIHDEFAALPTVSAHPDDVPAGCEDRNRFANVLPLPETRCFLSLVGGDARSEYVNANHVKGPADAGNYYIATQAPLENTVADFWRLVWEQNSRVIVMATDLLEDGVERCAEYLPASVVLDNQQQHGEFSVELKQREVKDKYAVSTLHVRRGARVVDEYADDADSVASVEDANANAGPVAWREIVHVWYQWPTAQTSGGAPVGEESAIVAMLLEVRALLKRPTVGSDVGGVATAAAAMLSGVGNLTEEQPPSVTTATINGKELLMPPEKTDPTTTKNAKTRSLARTHGPLTVHCSSGTGRTGTLIACDIAMRALEQPAHTVDIPNIVYFVRNGRAGAVATREQYEFIYKLANLYGSRMVESALPEK